MSMARSVRLRLSAGLAAGAVIAAIPVAAASASASTGTGSGARTPIQAGITAKSLPHATEEGTTAGSTPETVSFILNARGIGSLESEVTGGHFDYRNYLSVPQFASQYGQATTARALAGYLARYGIKTTVYADDLDVAASGTAAEFNSALDVTQHQYKVPAVRGVDGTGDIRAQTVHAVDGAPALPASIARNVLAVLGLTNYSAFSTDLTHTPATAKVSVSAAQQNAAANLPSNFAAEYGLSPLYKKANGAGETVAIVTLAALDQGAPEYFWQKVADVHQTGKVSVDNVDGGPGAPSDVDGTGETDLDVEQSGALAPGANVIVYQAPNTDNGFADAFFDAASQNIADSVSSSWGESETYIKWAVEDGIETPAYQAAFDEAFLEYAAQGQSGFIAAGDSGAYDATGDIGTTNLSVDSPGNSPYITDAGGTTNAWTGTVSNTAGTTTASVSVPFQRTWSWDYLWAPLAKVGDQSYSDAALANIAGGGGGFSVTEPRPSYQYDIPGIGKYAAVNDLTPTGYGTVSGSSLVLPADFTVNNPASGSTGYTAAGRVVPDVSADADPYTGYWLYEPSATQSGNAELENGWGGTSFVAPQLNGSTAEIDSYLGHRVGFWNPSVYAFAASGRDPFTPLDATGADNDNLYYTGTAGSLFNPASGLGTPNLSKLAQDFGGSGH
jgi:kumamolisin